MDLDNSGVLEEAEKPEKLHQADAAGKWRVALSTENLRPGRYTLIAKATDAVGFTAKATKTITIGAAASVAAAPKPTTSSIAGRVTDQDGQPLARLRVSLRGTSFTAVSDSDGTFAFKDVPHGKYKLEARGTAKNREVSGTQEIVLPSTTEPARLELRIEL